MAEINRGKATVLKEGSITFFPSYSLFSLCSLRSLVQFVLRTEAVLLSSFMHCLVMDSSFYMYDVVFFLKNISVHNLS